MAGSKHLGIRNAVAALLAGLAQRTTENQDRGLATDQASAISVKRMQSTPSQPTTAYPIDWTTELRVEITARDEATADAIACACFAAVMADESLGGIAEGLEPGAFEWDQDQGEETVHRVSWTCTVTHVTDNNVIT